MRQLIALVERFFGLSALRVYLPVTAAAEIPAKEFEEVLRWGGGLEGASGFTHRKTGVEKKLARQQMIMMDMLQ